MGVIAGEVPSGSSCCDEVVVELMTERVLYSSAV